MATAEFSKFAGILSAALSQHHLSGFGISHMCAYIPSLWSPLTSPHHPTPLHCHRAPGWPPLLDSSSPRAICFTHGHVYMSVALSQLVPPSLFPDMSQVCSPHLCLYSCPTNRFSSVQFSRSVVSDSFRPHESQHARPPCSSPTPGVH